MNCLGLVHHDAKLVAGCGDGRLYMFNWGEFGLHNADFPGHPDAINHLVSLKQFSRICSARKRLQFINIFPLSFAGGRD